MGKVVATYSYEWEDGLVYAQKLRREPGPNGEDKSFTWRRQLPLELRESLNLSPDEPAWAWGLDAGFYAAHNGNRLDWRLCHGDPSPAAVELPRCSPSLYRLFDLYRGDREQPVCFVEGEGKADRLTELGFVCVSGPNGARAWNYDHGLHFAGRRVVIFPDNNLPGTAHAVTVAGSLLLHGAAGVKLVRPGADWPIGDNEDVKDWLLKIPRSDRRKAVFDLLKLHPSYLISSPPPAAQPHPEPPGES